MDLQYTPEQNQFRESVERFVREVYVFGHRRKLIATQTGYDQSCWRQYAEFGWLALPFREEDGGLGGDAVDSGIVMESVGRGLLLEPYLPNVILGGGMLSALGSAEQKASWLQPMMAGQLKLALAYAEPDSRYEITRCEAVARRCAAGYAISGTKSLVYGGPAADILIVVARTSHGVGDREGLSAFAVEANASGLEMTPYATHDGLRAADFSFESVLVDDSCRLGAEGAAGEVLERVVDQGIAALASEAVGAMDALVSDTLEFIKTRQQFGRPIGMNQALQHRMVDMHIALDEARSMALYGALMLRDPSPMERRRALSATKMEIDRAARRVGQEAVQFHGAMGVTDELAIGHYFKRLSMIATTFGDTDWHVERYMGNEGERCNSN